jgi:hypothetical protein
MIKRGQSENGGRAYLEIMTTRTITEANSTDQLRRTRKRVVWIVIFWLIAIGFLPVPSIAQGMLQAP